MAKTKNPSRHNQVGSRALTARTKARLKARFLTRLRRHGNILHACLETPCGRNWVYDQRDKDPAFAADWELALEGATQNLEHEAWRRGVQGWREPVFHQGVEVATVRKFSDTLLIFLLKARRPKMYRERVDVNHGGKVEHVQQLRIYLPSNGREVEPKMIKGTVVSSDE